MSWATTATLKHFRGRIARTLLFYILPLFLIPVVIICGLYYLYNRQALPNPTLALVISALLVGLDGAVIWGVMKNFLKPLLELAKTIRLFSEGNWELRSPAKRTDEIGLLAYSFNQMADEMTIMYRKLSSLESTLTNKGRNNHTIIASADRYGATSGEQSTSAPPPGPAMTPEATPGTEGAPQDTNVARQPELTETSQLQQAINLYRAGFQIFQANNAEQVLDRASQALKGMPYATALLLRSENHLRLVRRQAPHGKSPVAPLPMGGEVLGGAPITTSFPITAPFLVNDLRAAMQEATAMADSGSFPLALLQIPLQMGCTSAAFLPVLREGSLTAMLILGAFPETNSDDTKFAPLRPPASLKLDMIAPYTTLVELVASALDRIRGQQDTQRNLSQLELLSGVSQTVSLETDLSNLFQAIHQQVVQVMGTLDSFAIALYDAKLNMIRIPYMFEEGQMQNIAPFPMGEGLTSIVVRTALPLRLVEDTEARSRELGAKVVGKTAKSWLGVPMIFAGEIIGVMIAQDLEREGRFTEEDQRLLNTLASQVAVIIRNASLLEASRRQARQERLQNEIKSKIGRAADIQSVLKTTATELGTALGAVRAHIELQTDANPSDQNTNTFRDR